VSLKDFIIRNNIEKNKRTVQFHNLKTAKKIAVLYCINNDKDYEEVKHFATYLSDNEIDISSLAFVKKQDEIGNKYFGQSENHFFSEKHITKFGKIKEDCIKNFIDKKFDICINLCIDNNFYSEYIFALTNADFKVSGIIDCKYSDLNINIESNKKLSFLIEQITYYLNVINKA